MAHKKLKKAFAISGIVVVVLLALLIIVPTFFQKQIVNLALKEANERLNAKFSLEDFRLTMFRTFPNPTVKLEKVCAELKGDFEGDTLLTADKIFVSIDLFSFFSDVYKINTVTIDGLTANLVVDTNGNGNWNILPPDTVESEPSSFALNMDNIHLKDIDIFYSDYQSNMFASVENLEFSLKGDLSSEATDLKTALSSEKVNFKMDGINFVNDVELGLKAHINADFQNNRYTIGDNEIKINALILQLEGWLALLDNNDMDMDITLTMPQNNFKNLLSLVPAIYKKDFNTIKVTGNVALSAFAKGVYTENSYPAFGAELNVGNASFQYPALPEKVENINIAAKVSNAGGSLNNTIINVNKLHLEMLRNPFDLTARVSTPMTDPNVSLTLNGKVNLGDIKKVYPLEEGIDLQGIFTANLAIKGLVSYIEKEEYQKFQASGSLNIKNVVLKQNKVELNNDIAISEVQLDFTPAYATLSKFDANVGRNDVHINGKIENYIPFVFSDGTLKGNVQIASNYLNINDLYTSSQEATTAEEESEMALIVLPENFDIRAKATIGELVYDRIDMKKALVDCQLKDKKLTISDLKANLFAGSIGINGSYYTPNALRGDADVNIDIKNISTKELCQSFTMFDKFMPVLSNLDSRVSVKLDCETALNETMSPDYNTINSQGRLTLTDIDLKGLDVVNQVIEQIKMDKLKTIRIKDLLVTYTIKEGQLQTKPFGFNVDKAKVNVEAGSVGLDKSLHYTAVVSLPTSIMGNQAIGFAQNLIDQVNAKGASWSLGNTVDFAVSVGGTMTKPKVTVGLNKARSMKELSEQITEKVEEVKQQVVEQAKATVNKALEEAQAQADKLVAAAQQQADALIKAQKAANEKILAEAKSQADKMVAEAKNPLEKIAKQKAADLVLQKAQQTADEQTAATQKKADQLIADAKAKGTELINKAKAN